MSVRVVDSISFTCFNVGTSIGHVKKTAAAITRDSPLGTQDNLR